MINRNVLLLGTAALLAQMAVMNGCSDGGGSTPGGTGGGGGQSGGGTGGSTTAASCSASDYPIAPVKGAKAGGANTDPGCNSDQASSSMSTPCTKLCCVTCGIDSAGEKICTCEGGIYNNCACNPPPGFPSGLQGGKCTPFVPYTDTTLRNTPCPTEWAVCFTSDSTPSSERGCVCMMNPDTTTTWHCGSVNHWFVNNGT